MNNPIYIKLKYLDERPCIIKVEDIDEIEPTKDRDASKVRTEEYIYTVRETPEQIEKALKAAGIQIIDCGASVEDNKWFRVIDEKDHCFPLGGKIQLIESHYDSNNKAFYKKDGTTQCLFNYQVELWIDEPTLTNDKN